VPGARYDINGRTVFITGAARGIGKATAERLHAKGANVALVGLEPERLEANAAQLGDRAIAIEADVTDSDALERAVAVASERFGGIDVAIANAGIAFNGPLASTPAEHIERTLAVNLLGVWRTDRAVLGKIVERRGYLLNIASMAAVLHLPMLGAYAAAKAGVEALSDALRVEIAPSGVAVGCAYFGFLDTDLVRAAYAEPAAQALNETAPPFLRDPAPLSNAIDAVERGVARRARRVYSPRWLPALLLLRGIAQPLTERRTLRDPAPLQRAMRLAEEANATREQHPVLGIAAKALD
jgi:NAD(P)-dependent dehydrogenase (short-subunit alcohol dehydrogenase family)